MPIEVRISLLNAREVDKTLARIARQFGGRNAAGILGRTTRKVLKPYLETLRAGTPVDKGNLIKTCRVRVYTFRKREITTIGVLGWGGLGGKYKASKPQALAIEYGTKRRREKGNVSPVLRPIFERSHSAWLGEFARLLGIEIDKTARRLANRRASRTLRIR